MTVHDFAAAHGLKQDDAPTTEKVPIYFYFVSYVAQGPEGIDFGDPLEIACEHEISSSRQLGEIALQIAKAKYGTRVAAGAALIGAQLPRVKILGFQPLRVELVDRSQIPQTRMEVPTS